MNERWLPAGEGEIEKQKKDSKAAIVLCCYYFV